MMIKLLVLVSWYPTKEMPQSGIFFKKQAEILSDIYDVKVVVCNTQLIGKKKAIHNIIFKPNNSKNYITSSKFEVIDLNLSEYTFLNHKTRINNILNIGELKIETLFATWKPNIIHAHDCWLAGVLANKISAKSHIPFVLTCHSPFSFNTSSTYVNKLIKRSIVSTNQLITVSNQDRRNYESLVEPTINPITFGNYIDTEIFNPRKVVSNANNDFKIIQITRPHKIKDIPTFLNAVNYFINNYKIERSVSATLILSQTDNSFDTKKFLKQTNESGMFDFLNIKLNITNEEIADELSTSNVYISTSFYETFGVAIAEAIAMGIPTIVVDNGASTDFAKNNENCLYADMGDFKKIAEHINKIYTNEIVFNPDLMHKSIEEKYSKEKYLAQLTTIYKKVLSENKN